MALFEPRSVAVIGAGRQRGGIGAEVFHSLRESGFRGPVLPVNPRASVVENVPAYASITAIPDAIDLAVIAVPCDHVSAVVDECIAKRVRAIVVVSAGFAETGPEGAAREAAIRDKVRRAGIRMVGPNCLGLLNTDPAIRLNATFAAVFPPAGHVAFSSQSGALGLAVLAQAQHLGIGLSSFVSVGNKADVSTNDLIEYWGDDERTSVILLYVESFGNPRRFREIARRVSRVKPILAVKAGRSSAGMQAARSHTGALAASDRVVDALFHDTGVIRTDTLEELFEAATLFANQPMPAGNRVAILTNAGGPGILAADACIALGLTLPPLSVETETALRAFLPPNAGLGNPVDMIATATADDYERALARLLDDPGVDSVLVLCTPIAAPVADVAAAIVRATQRGRKPVLATFFGSPGAMERLSPVPCYTFPESSARALAHAVAYAQWRQTPAPDTNATTTIVDRAVVREVLGRSVREDGWLSPLDSTALMTAAGVPVVPTTLVHTVDAAASAARALGYPVVIKGTGPTLLHKTDAHAVTTNIGSEETVRHVATVLLQRADVAGLLVQPMVHAEVEMLVGAVWHDRFGHAILCGAGGTLAELLQDSALRLSPLTARDAREMIDGLRSSRLLRGFRGAPASDEGALRDVLLRVSALVEACPEIREIDLNPVLVGPSGAVVADIRVRVAGPV